MTLAFIMSGAHLHLALNHLPIIGVPCALIPLVLALWWKDRKVLIAGFLLAFLTAAPIPLVMATGDGAWDEMTDGGGGPTSLSEQVDKEGRHWAHVHDERAGKAAVVIYLLAAVAAVGLVCTWKLPRHQYRVGVLTCVMVLLATNAAVWVADAGGRIHHGEFRDGATEDTVAEQQSANASGVVMPGSPTSVVPVSTALLAPAAPSTAPAP